MADALQEIEYPTYEHYENVSSNLSEFDVMEDPAKWPDINDNNRCV